MIHVSCSAEPRYDFHNNVSVHTKQIVLCNDDDQGVPAEGEHSSCVLVMIKAYGDKLLHSDGGFRSVPWCQR